MDGMISESKVLRELDELEEAAEKYPHEQRAIGMKMVIKNIMLHRY